MCSEFTTTSAGSDTNIQSDENGYFLQRVPGRCWGVFCFPNSLPGNALPLGRRSPLNIPVLTDVAAVVSASQRGLLGFSVQKD